MLPLDAYPERLRRPLRACASGRAPANIALMQVLIEALDREEVDAVLARVGEDLAEERDADTAERLRRLGDLWAANPQAFDVVKSVLAQVDHGATAASADEGVSRWASLFDRMAQASPEGGVALYALGNPELLKAATAEVVQYLRTRHLVGPDSMVLEIGCGIGRFVAALSPAVRHITGLDISDVMIARARERCSGLANVTLAVSSGRDLASVRNSSIDLILAADVFPYLVQAGPGLVERHLSEGARVLKPGGSLVVFNYSYRGNEEADRAELARLAQVSGLRLGNAVQTRFSLWDAAVFHLSKA
jgi:ubiquinone/menaquinone biosynthesis C-methylase UbiE